ncbi:phiSA1p31-related protein [Streptomyces coeruleorubidus]|uniref:phiSA1p31-related protein n=1 Tax=Streptomyces coeruleorubidus TaxID=116188 RepID=UPI003816CFDD
MTTDLDGTPVDLDRVQVALDGSRWLWNFEHTDAGDPLMQRLDGRIPTVLPLPTVRNAHGPVLAEQQPTTSAMYRQVLEAAS